MWHNLQFTIFVGFTGATRFITAAKALVIVTNILFHNHAFCWKDGGWASQTRPEVLRNVKIRPTESIHGVNVQVHGTVMRAVWLPMLTRLRPATHSTWHSHPTPFAQTALIKVTMSATWPNLTNSCYLTGAVQCVWHTWSRHCPGLDHWVLEQALFIFVSYRRSHWLFKMYTEGNTSSLFWVVEIVLLLVLTSLLLPSLSTSILKTTASRIPWKWDRSDGSVVVWQVKCWLRCPHLVSECQFRSQLSCFPTHLSVNVPRR